MVALGQVFADGRGVKRDERSAASGWGLAAAKGDPAAEYRLGTAHLRGRGVAKSDSLARYWLGTAAEQWHEGARSGIAKRRE